MTFKDLSLEALEKHHNKLEQKLADETQKQSATTTIYQIENEVDLVRDAIIEAKKVRDEALKDEASKGEALTGDGVAPVEEG